MKRLLAFFLIISLLLSGCTTADTSTETAAAADPADCAETVTDFSLALLQNSQLEGKNTLVSPLSVLAALGMTANGADGETLAQMTQALGLSPEALNGWISQHLNRQGDQLKLANAIWLRNDGKLTVEEDFLKTATDCYQADVFREVFDDSTLNQINGWVKEHTDGMIPAILDRMDPSAVMYLVNALAFADKWEEPYLEFQVSDSFFTREDGTEQAISMMHSTEHQYLEADNAVGFLKYYEGRKFAFAALLPNEGISMEAFLASLTGEQLRSLLSRPWETEVRAALPKFQTEFDTELSEVLMTLGMADAFDPDRADFSRMGTGDSGNLYISRVLHKTAITVAEEGTKAAAATAVEMALGSAYNPDLKFVTLDRPFVYMLIDCETNTPFFIGTMMDMEGNSVPTQTETADTRKIISAPPELLLTCQGEEAVLLPGSYEWTVPGTEFAEETVTACGPAPLDYAGKEPVFAEMSERMQLTFRVPDGAGGFDSWPPDDIRAFTWDEKTGDAVSMQAGQEIQIPPGGWEVVEIIASWNGYGSASYVLPVGK